MYKILLTGLFSVLTPFLFAQPADTIINSREVKRVESRLAADDMRGRKVFTPDIDRAAGFIAEEFRNAGLQTWDNGGSYLQPFAMVQPHFVSASAVLDGKALEEKNIVVVTSRPELEVGPSSGFALQSIKPGASLFAEAFKYVQSGKNLLVLVDSSYSASFHRLVIFKRQVFKGSGSIIFLLTQSSPKQYIIKAKHTLTEAPLANVVGVLPGKTRKDEYVVFSGHYDHLGVGKPENGDSIYNGANDDVAGTTAVIMLAKYFKVLGNNERTLVFAAFTAEEEGGFGSQYFSRQFDPSKVAAMFNIEMIGTESKWGRNSAYITGYDKTDMGAIMQRNLQGTPFQFYPDPYPEQQLFYRSDNATLARMGVPAHTISTSKMDNEPNYHKVTDEIGTLDMENMAMIIRAIAKSAVSIVSGKDTPSRVNTADLR